MKDHLFWVLGLLLAVIATAALVNRFNPHHRARVRRVAILFVFYLVAEGAYLALAATNTEVWASRALVGAELLRAFTIVNIVTTVTFSVALPASGAALPMIASDLLIGFGYAFATLGVLSTHGLNPTGALASAAVVSAVLAISLQSTLGNILGGVALQLDGSVHEGDWVQLTDGRQGRVRAIRWRHTVVETRDWSTIIVPNSTLLASNIILLGKRDGRSVPQRMWIWFHVDFRHPPTRVIQVVSDALAGCEIQGVATDPPPNCICMDFAKDNRDSYAAYAVRYWLTDLAADDPTSSRVRARIFTALRRANIPLAIPGRQMWVQVEDEERAKRKVERQLAERESAVANVALFRALTEDERKTIADGLSPAIYAPGEMITRQGAVAHWLYILVKGTVEIRTKFDPDGDGPAPAQTKVVAKLVAPSVFGEMGLMTGEPRSADVVALSDCECYRLERAVFERVLLARPEIAEALSAKLAARRMELIAVREDLDDKTKQAREARERDRILDDIKSFFALDSERETRS